MTLDHHHDLLVTVPSSSNDVYSALLADSEAYTNPAAGGNLRKLGETAKSLYQQADDDMGQSLLSLLAGFGRTDSGSLVFFRDDAAEARFKRLADNATVNRNGDNVTVTLRDDHSFVYTPEIDGSSGIHFDKKVTAKVTDRNGVIDLDDISGISIGKEDSWAVQRYGLSRLTIRPGEGANGQDRITIHAGWGVHIPLDRDVPAGTAAQIRAELKKRGVLK